MRARPLTLAELVPVIAAEPPGPWRTQLEEWYWAKAADVHGVLLAHWHRQEYEWLIAAAAERRRRQHEKVMTGPALGAYPSWRDLRKAT